MAIDFDLVMDTFIDTARDALPTELSTIGQNNNIPAVIRARQNAPKPDYPYVMVDITNTSDTFGWRLTEGVEDVGGEDTVFTETHRKLLITYTVYGGNAISIANILKGYFTLGSTLDAITTATTTGGVEQLFDVDSTPVSLSTEIIEAATLSLTFNINDHVSDPNAGVFDRIILDGELSKGEDDPSPLPMDVDVGPVT